jgi:predicted ABC-type ATPase
MQPDKLKKKYSLSKAETDDTVNLIISRLTNGITASDVPTAVIIGGQPGCGKTELQRIAEDELNNNIVICNGDNLREFHPHIVEIKKLHEDLFPAMTIELAHQWNNELCRYCRENKLNYILETTFATGEGLNDTIRELKQAGYRVIIKLLAVHSRQSLLGTYLRFESMKKIDGFGRRVSRNNHDDRYQEIPHTLTCVLQASLFDELSIYGRHSLRNNMVQPLNKVIFNQAETLSAYLKERDKQLSGYAKDDYWDKFMKVLAMMIDRNASKEELQSFFGDFKGE